jgi:hypothetical protein
MDDIVFEVADKTGRKIRLTKKQWNHIQKHPHMHESLERIEETIKNPLTIRYDEYNQEVNYFYKEYKNMELRERYLFVSVKYLNGTGFVITSFYTNKITGLKWKE